MKKCPFCKAEIEDGARFCLYCMTPLTEKTAAQPLQKKRRRWLWIPVILLCIGLLIGLLLHRGSRQPDTQTGETTDTTQTTPQTSEQTVPQTTQGVQPDTKPPIPETTTAQTTEQTAPETTPETTEQTVPEATPETTEQTAPETTPETTEPSKPQVSSAYTYRLARTGDDFSASYSNNVNDIVITGVVTKATDGVYKIPAYIDGQRVIAIMANAFYGSGARVVYLPSTVKTVWNYAFNGCSVTDVYFTQNVYIEAKAFPEGELTVHCPKDCHDRSYYYYSSGYYCAYEEWNG